MTLGIALASFAFSSPAGSKLAQPPKGLAELALPVLAAGVLAVGARSQPSRRTCRGQQYSMGIRGVLRRPNVIVPEKTLEKDVRRATQFCAHGPCTIANAAHSV